MRRWKSMPEDKVREMAHWYARGYSIREVSKETGVSSGTISRYFSMWKRGIKKVSELFDLLALERGHNSHYWRYGVYRNKGGNRQEFFEEAMPRMHEKEPYVRDILKKWKYQKVATELSGDVKEALESLKNSNTRLYEVIFSRYFGERTLEEVGRELGGISREAVRQLEVKALEFVQRKFNLKNHLRNI